MEDTPHSRPFDNKKNSTLNAQFSMEEERSIKLHHGQVDALTEGTQCRSSSLLLVVEKIFDTQCSSEEIACSK